jgi:hypothetical protein
VLPFCEGKITLSRLSGGFAIAALTSASFLDNGSFTSIRSINFFPPLRLAVFNAVIVAIVC